MKGVLEVLVVNAKGIGHTNLIGKTKYFVIVKCGNQFYKTKTSQGNPKEICWNEKFTFEMKNHLYLKIQIMDEELFTDGGLVGETTICLKGIVSEGENKGQADIRQTPYNVLLEDDTYKGQICIGLKYISNKKMVEATADRGIHKRDEVDVKEVVGPSDFVLKTFSNLWQRILFLCNKNTNSSAKDMPN